MARAKKDKVFVTIFDEKRIKEIIPFPLESTPRFLCVAKDRYGMFFGICYAHDKKKGWEIEKKLGPSGNMQSAKNLIAEAFPDIEFVIQDVLLLKEE